jgi:hypothetical protein
MPTPIQRSPNLGGYEVFFASSSANSTTISLGNFSSLSVVVDNTPSASAIISWFAAKDPEGPYVPIYLSGEEAAYTSIPQNGVYVAPPELFCCHYLRGVVNNPSFEFTGTVLLKG